MPRSESRVSRRTRLIGGERYVIEVTEFALRVFHHGLITSLRLNLGTRYVEAA
jgi:hypothetical protein